MSGCSPLTHDRIPVWNTTRLRASFSIGCSIQHTRAKIQSLTDQQAQLLKRSTYGGMTAEDAKEYDAMKAEEHQSDVKADCAEPDEHQCQRLQLIGLERAYVLSASQKKQWCKVV